MICPPTLTVTNLVELGHNGGSSGGLNLALGCFFCLLQPAEGRGHRGRGTEAEAEADTASSYMGSGIASHHIRVLQQSTTVELGRGVSPEAGFARQSVPCEWARALTGIRLPKLD
jgi:hypothetical protein